MRPIKRDIARSVIRGIVSGDVEPEPPVADPIEWYQFGRGILVQDGGVQQWDGAIGGHHLAAAVAGHRPVKQGDGSILFDGAAQKLVTPAWTQAQPVSVCILFKQITWVITDAIFDTDPGMLFLQYAATPNLSLYGGSAFVAENANMPLDTYKGVVCVFNGASSLIHVEGSAATTGNPGTAGIGRLFLGSNSSGTGISNIQVKDMIVYDRALDATERQAVFDYWATL